MTFDGTEYTSTDICAKGAESTTPYQAERLITAESWTSEFVPLSM